MGSDRCCRAHHALEYKHFNPRSPYGERRVGHDVYVNITANFNPRSPYGERLYVISGTASSNPDFNPRSPYGERLAIFFADKKILLFQSTLPVWGATDVLVIHLLSDFNFNPRSPYGERRQVVGNVQRVQDFNPRSPYGERRGLQRTINGKILNFNPRSPYGERPSSCTSEKLLLKV